MQKIKIAFVWSHSLGDFIVASPILQSIKKRYPNSEIKYIAADTPHQELFLSHPSIDTFFEIKRKKNLLLWKSMIQLRRMRFDILFSPFPQAYKSRMLLRFIKAKKKFVSKEKIFSNKNIIEKGFSTLRQDGIADSIDPAKPIWPFDLRNVDETVNTILYRHQINSGDRIIIIHCGYKQGYLNRSWGSVKWAQVIDHLTRHASNKIFFIGAGSDGIIANEVFSRIRKSTAVINLIDQFNIKELAAFINQAFLLITHNSGPMWIGAALKKRQIAICGPSSFQWDPYNSNAKIVRNIINRKKCNPPCDAKKCAYADRLCMESISVSDVIAAIDTLMAQPI
ncbi:MAG: glycosyltransferase family 9 protein [Patescibacteria group bacterium]